MWGLLHTHFPSLPLGTDFGTHWVFFFFFFLSGDCSSVLLDTGAPGAFIKTQFKESQFIAFILPNKIKWVVSHQWSLRKITFGKWAHLPEECSNTGLIQIGESLPLRQEAVGFQSFMLATEPYAWWMMICKVSWGVFGVFFFFGHQCSFINTSPRICKVRTSRDQGTHPGSRNPQVAVTGCPAMMALTFFKTASLPSP